MASIPLHPTMSEATNFMFAGFIVVMAVLFAMYVFMKILGLVFAGNSAKAAAAKKSAPAARPAPVAAAPAPASSNAQLVAVIAAAAHAVLGNPVRIVSVKPSSAEWGAEGRRQIFASKNVR